MSHFIIIRGPAGAGKTTISKIVAKKLNAEYISFDEIMKKNKLNKIEGEGITAENFINANKLIIPLAIKKLNAGKIIVFDGCFYRKEQIKHLRTKLKFKHIIFTLDATLEDCQLRNSSRKKSISRKAIKDVYSLVNKLNIGIKVDTSGRTISRIVNEIIAKSGNLKKTQKQHQSSRQGINCKNIIN